jgi:hypothetical protein
MATEGKRRERERGGKREEKERRGSAPQKAHDLDLSPAALGLRAKL